jgi:preprotein translocase subunit SecG
MGILIGSLYVIVLISAILLIGIVLIQQSKQGGIGSLTSSNMSGDSFLGTSAATFITKATAGLATIFLAGSFFLAVLIAHNKGTSLIDRVEDANAKSNKAPTEQTTTTEEGTPEEGAEAQSTDSDAMNEAADSDNTGTNTDNEQAVDTSAASETTGSETEATAKDSTTSETKNTPTMTAEDEKQSEPEEK